VSAVSFTRRGVDINSVVTSLIFTAVMLIRTTLSTLRPAIGQEAPPPAAFGADWPTFRGNNARTGVAGSPGPHAHPQERWRFSLPTGVDTGRSSPTVAGGIVYVGAWGILYAVDAKTGIERGLYVLPEPAQLRALALALNLDPQAMWELSG
jgi:hypothetical protein